MPIVLTLSHFLGPGSFFETDFAQPWARALEARTQGRVRVETHCAGSPFGSVHAQAAQVRAGTVDIALGLRGAEGGRFPRSAIAELPFMVRDAATGSRAVWEFERAGGFGVDYAAFKLLALTVHNPGLIHTARRRVVRVADVEGLRLRAPNAAVAAALALIGAEPVILQVNDVMPALRSGHLDGVVTNWGNPLPEFNDHLTFHTAVAFYSSVFFVVMNRQRFDGLPPDIQQAIDAQSNTELVTRFGDAWSRWDARLRHGAREAGHEIIAPDRRGDGGVARQPATRHRRVSRRHGGRRICRRPCRASSLVGDDGAVNAWAICRIAIFDDCRNMRVPKRDAIRSTPMPIHRRTLLGGIAGLAGASTIARAAPATGEPILVGVSGPSSGPMAQYGAQWRRGFDLALETINGNGGVKGRPLQYVFEDSQADPRQSVGIGQKFVANPKIVMELGDFSSPASMAASPVYQRGKLVQFGFTNSHPDFTKGGDYMWSNSTNQADEQPQLAKYVIEKLGIKRPALLFLNTDWGRAAKDAFAKAATGMGAEVVASEGYLPTEQDFRPTLVRVRDAKPDAIVGESYYADGALIARQARDVGLKLPIVLGGSIYSPKFIELAGDAGNGVYTFSTFFPESPRPEVQEFVKAYRAKYDTDPDSFSAGAYDTMILVQQLCDQFGATREGIHEGLGKIHDVPSIIFGKVSFSPETRRVAAANYTYLQVQSGRFNVWDGKKAIS